MKIFLGNAPWVKGNRLGVRAGSRWPFTMEVAEGSSIPPYLPFPFYLAYSAAVLEKDSISVLLVDAIAEGIDDNLFIKRISEYKPDLALFETSTPSIETDLKIASRIKKETGALVVLSGPHVSVFPEAVLKENPFIDYVLIGEYEYTLRDLAERLEQKQDITSVPGLAYRKNGNTVIVNPRRPPIEDLNMLPWPARHFLPMTQYNDNFGGLPAPSLQMWASRGCPYRCIFCMWPDVMYGGHAYRVRDPVDVVAEIGSCIKTYGVKSIYFDDDVFNIGKERMLAICAEMRERGMRIPWAIMARADTIDSETLKIMAEAGLCAIKYGVESGTQEMVTDSGKALSLATVRETVRRTKALGVKTHLTFTIGLPGETKETVSRTLKFAIELDPDSAQFSLCTPFPGTRYFDIAQAEGVLLTKDWQRYDGAGTSVIKTASMSKEDLEGSLRGIVKAWNKYILVRKFRKNFWTSIGKGLIDPRKVMRVISDLLG